MLLLLSGQVLSEIADAIYLWERLGLFLCPAKALVLMSTMRSIRLDMRTAITISWAVC
ncbi:unknown [Blautia hydrogenotrophica CAG:147]|nr:unknown [Blautia hydrogenotrophica CAG:147]